MDDEDVLSLTDETCYAAEYTLQLYREHMGAGRYHDAQECINAYALLVNQVIHIENTASPQMSLQVDSNAVQMIKELKDLEARHEN